MSPKRIRLDRKPGGMHTSIMDIQPLMPIRQPSWCIEAVLQHDGKGWYRVFARAGYKKGFTGSVATRWSQNWSFVISSWNQEMSDGTRRIR